MGRRSRKGRVLEVIALETRAVPTVISPLAFGGAGLQAERSIAGSQAVFKRLLPSATGGGAGSGAGSSTGSASSATVGIGAPTSGYINPAILTTYGLAQSKFVARINGPFAVAPATFVGTLANATNGTNANPYTKSATYIGPVASNQFLQGTTLMRIQVPRMATPAPTPPTDGTSPAIITDGFVALRDRDITSTGTGLTLALQVTALDGKGRPTSLYWQVDGSSGGSYAGASGEGTATIRYTTNGHSKNSAGGAMTVFQGIVVRTGVSDVTLYDLNKFN